MRSRADPRAALAALVLALGTTAASADGDAAVRLLVQSSPLAGFRYAEAAAVWPMLREGDALRLVREPDNPYDPNAVRVEWRERKLGYVPRRENAALAWALDRGAPLKARIVRLREHPNPARRIEFEVYLE
ncbi:MAG: HIRAN domain-containing protein [Burkholderiales bacterium]|nr:HIRAN domain-containing protein [Burkholderiales bacterium]